MKLKVKIEVIPETGDSPLFSDVANAVQAKLHGEHISWWDSSLQKRFVATIMVRDLDKE